MKTFKDNKFEKIIYKTYNKKLKIDILFSLNSNKKVILKTMHIRIIHNYSKSNR
jgi:predicted restriction endonuclease